MLNVGDKVQYEGKTGEVLYHVGETKTFVQVLWEEKYTSLIDSRILTVIEK